MNFRLNITLKMNLSQSLHILPGDEIKIQFWLYLHWLEFILDLFGFSTTTSFVIFLWKNLRHRIEINVLVLLIHTIFLLMISTMHSVVKSVVILIGPLVTINDDIIMTSKATCFFIDLP